MFRRRTLFETASSMMNNEELQVIGDATSEVFFPSKANKTNEIGLTCQFVQ